MKGNPGKPNNPVRKGTTPALIAPLLLAMLSLSVPVTPASGAGIDYFNGSGTGVDKQIACDEIILACAAAFAAAISICVSATAQIDGNLAGSAGVIFPAQGQGSATATVTACGAAAGTGTAHVINHVAGMGSYSSKAGMPDSRTSTPDGVPIMDSWGQHNSAASHPNWCAKVPLGVRVCAASGAVYARNSQACVAAEMWSQTSASGVPALAGAAGDYVNVPGHSEAYAFARAGCSANNPHPGPTTPPPQAAFMAEVLSQFVSETSTNPPPEAPMDSNRYVPWERLAPPLQENLREKLREAYFRPIHENATAFVAKLPITTEDQATAVSKLVEPFEMAALQFAGTVRVDDGA